MVLERSFYENFSGSKKHEGFDVNANIDLSGKDADGNKQQQPGQTTLPSTTAEGKYQLDDTREEVRSTVGPGNIIIRDKDKQAELDAAGQTAALDDLNRDPDKAYEITKDKHVEIDYYLSDTSIQQAYEAGKTVVEVVGNAVDRMIDDGKPAPATANLKPYLNDPDVLAQLDQCQSQASADFNPLHWIVTSAYAGAMCQIKTAGGVVAIGSADAALLSGLQTEAAIGFGIAALIASPIVLLTTDPAGNQKDQTVTLANGTVVSVQGAGEQLNRNVSIAANGSTTTLIVSDDGFGGLIISGGSINGQPMTNGELERAKRDLNNAGYDVVLSESASGSGSSKTGASKGGSGAAAGAPDPDDRDPFKRPNSNLQKGDKIDLDSFDERVKVDGETRYEDSKSGCQIVKDRAGTNSHGGSAWKLLDKSGNRVGTLNSDGTYLRK